MPNKNDVIYTLFNIIKRIINVSDITREDQRFNETVYFSTER